MPARSNPAARLRRFQAGCDETQLEEALTQEGVAVVEGALCPAALARIKAELEGWFAAAPCGEGQLFGRRTRRFGGLFAKAPATAQLANFPMIFSAVERVLKGPAETPTCDVVELNLTQAIAIEPGEAAQILHRDEALWPVQLPYEIMANVMWALDDFTEHNGATRVVPCSHRWDRTQTPEPGDTLPITVSAGSAIMWVGGLLHGGGANRSSSVRRGLVISYRLGWLAPAERLLLSVPPDAARRLPREVQRLIGYQLHRPNLGWIEGQDPIRWLDGEIDTLAPAADNLSPEAEARMQAVLTRPEFAGYRT